MTGRQEYDRTKDRQRTLDKYMIDIRTLRFVYCKKHGQGVQEIQTRGHKRWQRDSTVVVETRKRQQGMVGV